ncbi:MAG: hypothetical protein RR397_07965 [Odoribacter sp.]
MREHIIYLWNTIGVGLNGSFVWLKLNEWYLKDVSELAGIIVPILAFIWWCIKIFQTLKRNKNEKN